VTAPWVDVYEDWVRAASDIQLGLSRSVQVEPARSFLAAAADLSRDVGATQISIARWLLDA
jgi:hypothetical protein